MAELNDILLKIKAGWIAAVVSGVMTLGIALVVLPQKDVSLSIWAWTAADIAIILILAYGIYRRSPWAAGIMIVYFIASKIWIILTTEKPSALIKPLIFLFFYVQALIGTIQYHRLPSAPDRD